VIKKIGYTSDEYRFDSESCAVLVTIHNQSPDIARGVNEGEGLDKEQGAGDQGMMFGYATNETEDYMPLPLSLAHQLVQRLADIRKNEHQLMPYLRPDSKAQVTVEYSDDDKPLRVHTVVVSTQHDEFIKPKDHSKEAVSHADEAMLSMIRKDVIQHVVNYVVPPHLLKDTLFHINPTGKFVIGGPHGDTGLTGRKIIVDTYGGKGAHGGGAFSGKDSSKVDRSAAYAARHMAKNMVAAGITDEVLVQVAYAIGLAKPVSLTINTYGKAKVKLSDNQIASKISEIFDLRPKAIIERLGLKNPIFSETAAYGHVGRKPFTRKIEVSSLTIRENNEKKEEIRHKEVREIEFFTWEKLDYVDLLKKEFNL
jgi:S-adenosylmethionine synthetase